MLKTTAMTSIAAMALTSCTSSKRIQKGENDMTSGNIINNSDFDDSYLIMSDSQRMTVNRGNEFALNLFRTQAGMDSKVVSPLSAAYLMGMLANGAEGNTYSEIMKTLGMEGIPVNTLNEAYKAIINTASRLDRQTSINIANCIAVNKRTELKTSYKNAVTEMYDADVENLDFASANALKAINGWCSKQTNGMIPKIVDKLDANALAVLMNAIYFNGKWEHKFDKNNTKLEAFRGYTRDIKRVQMMHQNAKLYYTDNDMLSAVNLPYGNGAYSMTVILPKEGKSTEEVAQSLTAEAFEKLNRNMEQCETDLKLPRFSISTETQLNKPISELGAPLIFQSGKADFSKMSDTPMFISAMIQKAKIEVSEEGTKAAAVTAGIMTMAALPDREPRHVAFHADHPFIYIITERNTGAIFFIGQYTGTQDDNM